MDFVEKLAEWIAAHKGQTHAVAGVVMSAGLAYATVPAVQETVNGIVGPHPRLLGIMSGIGALLLLYHQPRQVDGAVDKSKG